MVFNCSEKPEQTIRTVLTQYDFCSSFRVSANTRQTISDLILLLYLHCTLSMEVNSLLILTQYSKAFWRYTIVPSKLLFKWLYSISEGQKVLLVDWCSLFWLVHNSVVPHVLYIKESSIPYIRFCCVCLMIESFEKSRITQILNAKSIILHNRQLQLGWSNVMMLTQSCTYF